MKLKIAFAIALILMTVELQSLTLTVIQGMFILACFGYIIKNQKQ